MFFQSHKYCYDRGTDYCNYEYCLSFASVHTSVVSLAILSSFALPDAALSPLLYAVLIFFLFLHLRIHHSITAVIIKKIANPNTCSISVAILIPSEVPAASVIVTVVAAVWLPLCPKVMVWSTVVIIEVVAVVVSVRFSVIVSVGMVKVVI